MLAIASSADLSWHRHRAQHGQSRARSVENLQLLGTGNIDGTGNGIVNMLTGTDGANTLDGLVGADSMYGGAGDDTYVVDNAGDVTREAAGNGVDLVLSSASFSIAGQHVEKLTLTGTNDIGGSGNELDNTITGNAGNNALIGLDGADVLDGRPARTSSAPGRETISSLLMPRPDHQWRCRLRPALCGSKRYSESRAWRNADRICQRRHRPRHVRRARRLGYSLI